MSSDDPKTATRAAGAEEREELSPSAVEFLEFLADRALAELLKAPPANDNDDP